MYNHAAATLLVCCGVRIRIAGRNDRVWSRFIFTTGEHAMRHSIIVLTIVPALALAFLCNRTEATLFYNFEEVGTGTVLATLELASLPATHTEVLGLTFTPAGQAFFGFGETYQGSFDTSVGDSPAAMVDDGFGGLRSTRVGDVSFLTDNDPPSSATAGVLSSFALSASSTPGRDSMIGHIEFFRRGDWRAIPEASSLVLAVSSVLIGVGVGSLRKGAS